MSDEEATVTSLSNGQTVKVYNILLCRWRAPQVVEYMMQIDHATQEREKQSTRSGNRALPRVRSVVESTREAPAGLPRALYNQQWLSQQQDWWVEEVLNVSQETFEFLVTAASGSDSSASI